MHIPHDTHAAALLGAYFDPWGSSYYRVAVPVRAAGGAVAPFYEMRESQVAAAEAVVVSRWSARAGTPGALQADIVRLLQRGGRRVILDLDDDHRRIADPARRAAANLAALEAVARAVDTVVVTCEALARRLRDWARDVRVLPNYIVPADWPEPAPQPDGPAVLVLAGSSTHADDWRLVAPALRRLKARHGAGVRLRTVGYRPPYLADIVDEHRPWGGLDGYPAALAGAHVGLCPLPDTPFNRCKTPIKAYEYALAGMAVVGSPTQYGPLLRAVGQGAHVVGDAGNWLPIIDHLITNRAACQSAADALRRHVVATLDVGRHVETIRAAYAA